MSASAGLVWVDYAGAVVGEWPVLLDDAGVIWPLDLEIGDVSTEQTRVTYWTDAGCSGVGVLSPAPLPREAVRVGSAWRVRGDNQPSQLFTVSSYSVADGGCTATPAVTLRGVRSGETAPYTRAPDTGFVGPLHRELR